MPHYRFSFFRGLRNNVLLLFLILNPALASAEPLEKYAPVFVQESGRLPLYDLITQFDFDGNFSGRDNVGNATKFAIPAVVYGDVVAETADSLYLFYGVYHLKDYDTVIREFFFPSAQHDNDFEGLMLLVDKSSGRVLAMETWWHNKFLQYALTPSAGGTQTIDGALHVEDETHLLVFVQSAGHGVRGLQLLDQNNLKEHTIYRLGAKPTKLTPAATPFADYIILPFSGLFSWAHGPFNEASPFSNPQNFEIGREAIGKYFSGRFKGSSSWARPKPPWSWSDKFDTLRPGVWFFHPAYTFNQHFNFNRSERYLSNLPQEKLLKVSQSELDAWALKKAPSYFNDIPQGPFHAPLKKLRRFLFNLTEYFFYLFG